MMTPKEYKALYESKEFEEKYCYDGDDLGACCMDGYVVFQLWSPLAKKVILRLYEDDVCKEAYLSVPMEQRTQGVWYTSVAGAGHGTYYDYEIVFEQNQVTSADPWAKAAGCNGKRSMVVDLSRTDPPGWEKDQRPAQETEQFIYEIHVKDFSNDPASGIPNAFRGKYKAFTCEGTTIENKGQHATCVDYLKELGVTHVQVLPVYDFGSIDEDGEPDQFNWGYDPINYNVPEGSYATDPHCGEVRILEWKEAIQTLHRRGIGVIMDVVYNHTFSLDSWLNRTNPYYFYRQHEDGSCSNGSDCGNDIASERKMCANYILQSVLYWAEEYHLDGFRFDLMGLLDVELLNRIRNELDKRYGTGKILLYGEPWSAGESPMRKGSIPCNKEHIARLDTNIGVFCDNTRDSIKGHVFEGTVPGFVNGGEGYEQKIIYALTGWISGDETFPVKAPSQIISYVSAHDNLTLWDKLKITIKPELPFDVRDEEIVRAYKFAAAVYFCCQGRIFFQGGEEAARTKLGDENSYQSSAALNQIDWKRCYEYEDILNYYKGLIALRKQLDGLTEKSVRARERITHQKQLREGMIIFEVKNEKSRWGQLQVCFNRTKEVQEWTLPEGKWELLLDGVRSDHWKNSIRISGTQYIAPVSAVIYGKLR